MSAGPEQNEEAEGQATDAKIYQVRNEQSVQGQVIGEHNTIIQHFHGPGSSADPSSVPERIWNIPYPRNPFFTGRDDLLARLAMALKAGDATAISQPQAISGLGGIGKTQIAVEYAHQHRSDYQYVLWTLADTRESLVSGYITIAKLLDLPQKDEQDQQVIIEGVKNWLQTHGSWLLILDNADELTVVREFVPSVLDGHLLLTTRAQSMGRLAKRIEVETMDPDVGAVLLLRRASLIGEQDELDAASSLDQALARQITLELGGLPLALDQAGAYIEETTCSLADYQDLYRSRRTQLLKERGGVVSDHPESVATTWSISFKKVEERNPAAADLLRLCVFLAPDAIPEEIITKGAEHLGSLLQEGARDPLLLNKAIGALTAYSLVRRDGETKTLSVHRLVQTVFHAAMDEQVRNNGAEQDLRMVKVQQKISGTFRSLTGPLAFCRIRGYFSTMLKQGHRLCAVARQLFAGVPFPPVSAL